MSRLVALMSSVWLAILFLVAVPVYAAAPTITSFSPASGKSGDTVTIIGTGFTAASVVKFNSKVVTTLTVNSATSISATVPSGATTGSITVTTTGGTATSSGIYYVAPVITSFTPSKGSIGATVTITGLNFTPDMVVKFNDVQSTFFVVTNNTSITAEVPTGATSGKITAINSVGSGSSFLNFYVKPAITSFTPIAVNVGTVVTIKGTNFSGASAVSFGSIPAASYTVVNDTTITATVPVGATRDHISITTSGGIATSADYYCFPPTLTMFTPKTYIPGEVVTLYGTALTGATELKWYSWEGNLQNWLDFTIVNDTTITLIVPFAMSPIPIMYGGQLLSMQFEVTSKGGTFKMSSSAMLIKPFDLVASIDVGTGYLGPLSGVSLAYKLSGDRIYTGTVTFDDSGKGKMYALPGLYTLSLTGSHWLSRTIVDVDASKDNTVNVSLANGDTNGDGQVNLFDFVELDMNFDSYTPMTDLNGDGNVNLFDYTIIDQFFGAQADL